VTTVSGSATSPQPFTYAASTLPVPPEPPLRTCTVPKLVGIKLKAAKKRLRAAGCTLGSVAKKRGATAKTAKIVNQKPKPGTTDPAGFNVSVMLR
jgi:beta-lactam-binding protein with PASTA domain